MSLIEYAQYKKSVEAQATSINSVSYHIHSYSYYSYFQHPVIVHIQLLISFIDSVAHFLMLLHINRKS